MVSHVAECMCVLTVLETWPLFSETQNKEISKRVSRSNKLHVTTIRNLILNWQTFCSLSLHSNLPIPRILHHVSGQIKTNTLCFGRDHPSLQKKEKFFMFNRFKKKAMLSVSVCLFMEYKNASPSVWNKQGEMK